MADTMLELARPRQGILGMETESVARQMVRNYFGGRAEEPIVTLNDCVKLMIQFNHWLVDTNEILQRLVMDKINTELPQPIIAKGDHPDAE